MEVRRVLESRIAPVEAFHPLIEARVVVADRSNVALDPRRGYCIVSDYLQFTPKE